MFGNNPGYSMKVLGVKIVGGCCGTTPEYIKKLKVLFNAIASCSENNR
jgi:methionine synthase I (cobalamin-dependent)